MNIEQLATKIKQDIAEWDPADLPVATHVTENLLEILKLIQNSGLVGTNAPPHYLIMAYDHTEKLMKTSKSLKTLTDWVIQNFEPSVPVLYDKEFNNVMGGFLHGSQQGHHRRVVIDETRNKFYVAGAFDTYKGAPLNCLACFFLDGSPDAAFNSHAPIFGCYLPNISYSGALFISLQSDGKPVLAGYDSLMYPYVVDSNYILMGRADVDGTIDEAYVAAIGSGLGQGGGYYPRGMTVQPHDNKLVVTGDFWVFNGIPAPRIVRVFPNGTIDSAFMANVGTGFNGAMYNIMTQADGKLVFTGDAGTFNGVAIPRMLRLNPDGTLDSAYMLNVGTGPNGTAYHGCLQSDGKAVLCGSMTVFNGISSSGLVRVNTDGTPDAAFSANLGTGANATVWGVAQQADGKLLVGGSFTTWNGVAAGGLVRLNVDGTPDVTYNTSLGTGFNGQVASIAVQSNGWIIVAGNYTAFNGVATPAGIVRLRPNMPPPNVITSPW
jgi:uncharacterized delta-60 repeat protein